MREFIPSRLCNAEELMIDTSRCMTIDEAAEAYRNTRIPL
jgi:hypothetical protein